MEYRLHVDLDALDRAPSFPAPSLIIQELLVVDRLGWNRELFAPEHHVDRQIRILRTAERHYGHGPGSLAAARDWAAARLARKSR